MRDAVQLEGLSLVKENEEHKVLGVFVTTHGSTYIKVLDCETDLETNYEYKNFSAFLKKYKFTLKSRRFKFE